LYLQGLFYFISPSFEFLGIFSFIFQSRDTFF
jgi:hypothetical protein